MNTDDWGNAPFATPESLEGMWDVVRYFLGQYMPFIMIVVAVFLTWGVVTIIVSLFERKKRDEDDDDIIEYL